MGNLARSCFPVAQLFALQDLRTYFPKFKLNRVEGIHDIRTTKETEPLHKYIDCSDDVENQELVIEHNCNKDWNYRLKYRVLPNGQSQLRHDRPLILNDLP